MFPFAGPWSDSYVSRLRWAPTREAVSTGATHAQQLTGTGAYFRRALGARRDWPTNEVCFQATLVDPAGHDAAGPVECIAIDPYDPTQDEMEVEEEEPVIDVEEEEPRVIEEEEPPRADDREPETNAPQLHEDDENVVNPGGCNQASRGGSTPWALGLLLCGFAARRRRQRA